MSKTLESLLFVYLAEELSSGDQVAYFSLRHLSTSKPVVLHTQHLVVPINLLESYQGAKWRG